MESVLEYSLEKCCIVNITNFQVREKKKLKGLLATHKASLVNFSTFLV